MPITFINCGTVTLGDVILWSGMADWCSAVTQGPTEIFHTINSVILTLLLHRNQLLYYQSPDDNTWSLTTWLLHGLALKTTADQMSSTDIYRFCNQLKNAQKYWLIGLFMYMLQTSIKIIIYASFSELSQEVTKSLLAKWAENNFTEDWY